jgi:methanogenic corrinoid protein MtbC1
METPAEQLPKHPMRLVMRRTGLSADVLRAWEKRYKAVAPERSAGGQRLYSDEDVERLILLHQVTSNGRNISRVAGLGVNQLRAMLVEDAGTSPAATASGEVGLGDRGLLPKLLDATERLDGQELERLLRQGALHVGAATAIEQVVVPFLHEIGLRWHRNLMNPAHEHLATAVVQRTLHWILDGASPAEDAPRIVIASLQGERHEIGLQIVAAIASGEEWRVVFLGGDLPVDTIAEATRQTGARVLAISMVAAERPDEVIAGIAALRRALGDTVTILVGGAAAARLQTEMAHLGAHVVTDLGQLRTFLRTYQQRVG